MVTERDGAGFVRSYDAAGRVRPVSGEPGAAPPAAALRRLLVPPTVTEDWVPYQLWTLPCHAAGWVYSGLATAALLKGVGVSAAPATATVALSAAVKWVSKDGLGAVGRLVVGGRLGDAFDDDPRMWRLYAEAFAVAGSACEVATAAAPEQFLLLASAASLGKAVGKGLKAPSSRVILTHFASRDLNVGAVSAKEEVWEVLGQLVGLALSVGVLRWVEATATGAAADERFARLVALWAAAAAAHVGLRYVALGTLRFRTLNRRRAAAAARSFVDSATVPSAGELCAGEVPLVPARLTRPRAALGVTLSEVLGALPAGGTAPAADLLELYAGERYVLTWAGDGGARVALSEDCAPEDVLRALHQAAVLDASRGRAAPATTDELATSLAAAREGSSAFLAALAAAGHGPPQRSLVGASGSRLHLEASAEGREAP